MMLEPHKTSMTGREVLIHHKKKVCMILHLPTAGKIWGILVLQGIAEGKARMALIICCSPAASDAADTLSSLQFGTLAKSIMTSVQVCARSAILTKGSIVQYSERGRTHLSQPPET